MQNNKKVAIIGAGPSGICTAKELLAAGFDVTVFERSSKIGGVFASSYKELRLVNNNLLISFSDFCDDPDKQPITMWDAETYVNYLHRYAEHFKLFPHIKFDTSVVSTHQKDNNWRLTLEHNSQQEQKVFDFLVVCSGTHQYPNRPTLPDEADYTGGIQHSDEIKDLNTFKNKRVLIVGMGEYASDFTYLCVQSAKAVDVSIRRWPGYIIPRYQDNKPTDFDTTRLYHSLPKRLHHTPLGSLLVLKRKLEQFFLKNKVDLKIQKQINQYNKIVSELSVFERFTTKSEGIIRAILDHNVTIKSKIIRMQDRTVYFEDGSQDEYDDIILCTGYKSVCSFLEGKLHNLNGGSRNFYKYMFPLNKKNIAFIGFIRPGIGSIPPMAEMQARFLSLILQTKLNLPDFHQQRQAVLQQIKDDMIQFPLDSGRLTNLTDYLRFLDSYADVIGCAPPKGIKLLFSSPKLWWKLHHSFLCPAQFRLVGPGKLPEASKEIIKKLPSVPFAILWLEILTAILCDVLCFLGLKKYKRL